MGSGNEGGDSGNRGGGPSQSANAGSNRNKNAKQNKSKNKRDQRRRYPESKSKFVVQKTTTQNQPTTKSMQVTYNAPLRLATVPMTVAWQHSSNAGQLLLSALKDAFIANGPAPATNGLVVYVKRCMSSIELEQPYREVHVSFFDCEPSETIHTNLPMTVPRITLIFGPICRGEPDDCVMHVIKELYDSVDGNSVYPFGVIQIRPQDQRIQTNMIETALGPRPSYIGPKQNPESRFEEWTHVLDTLVDKELTAVASLRYHCTLLESSFSSSPQRPSGALTRIRAKIERARAVCNASMAEDGKSFLLTRLHPNDFEGIAYANEDSDDDDDDDEDGDGEGVTAGGQQAQFEFLMTVMLGVLGPMFEAQSHQGGMEDDGEARGTVDNLVGNIRTLSALGGLGSGGRLRIGPDGVRFFPHGQEPDDDVNINDNKNDDGGGGEVQDGEQASSVNVLAVESGDGSNSKRMKQSKESDSEEDA